MVTNISSSCQLCTDTLQIGSNSAGNDYDNHFLETDLLLCIYCQRTKDHMGDFAFAILFGLSSKNTKVRAIIRESSVAWIARNRHTKSSAGAMNCQMNFFESVPDYQTPVQAPVDPDEVQKIVNKALLSVQEVDSMSNLRVFVIRKGLEGG